MQNLHRPANPIHTHTQTNKQKTDNKKEIEFATDDIVKYFRNKSTSCTVVYFKQFVIVLENRSVLLKSRRVFRTMIPYAALTENVLK